MRAGRLDRQIIIQQKTTTYNSYNEPTDTWSTYKSVYAEVIGRTGREFLTSDQTIAERRAIFRIRYITGIEMTMRISYDSFYWDILDIRYLGRNMGLEIHARALVE